MTPGLTFRAKTRRTRTVVYGKKGVDYYSRNTISFVRYNHWGSSAAPSSDARRDHLWILAAVTVMTAATTPPANPNPTSATAAPRLPDAENAFAAA